MKGAGINPKIDEMFTMRPPPDVLGGLRPFVPALDDAAARQSVSQELGKVSKSSVRGGELGARSLDPAPQVG